MSESPARKPRATARERQVRRIRIMGMVQSGFSYEAIAPSEKISRERASQIVVRSLNDGVKGARVDPRLRQTARSEPALRLAANAIAEGDLSGIDRLIKVINKLDKYGPFPLGADTDEDIHKLFMDKLAHARRDPAVARAASAGSKRIFVLPNK